MTPSTCFTLPESFSEEEHIAIMDRYGDLERIYRAYANKEDVRKIEDAFRLALEAHGEVRRKSGEPYIMHPLRVALIVGNDMGLGAVSIIASLLHDVVEDTPVTLTSITERFGSLVAKIVGGLTKVRHQDDLATSFQARNYAKLIKTFSTESRIIFIKIADRLDNMRALEKGIKEGDILKIVSEAYFFYIPLCHQLGLHGIKATFEDLYLKYRYPLVYQDLDEQLKATKAQCDLVTASFFQPIEKALEAVKIKFRVHKRIKSHYSIWQKMQKQGVGFADIYDIIALRIILDVPPEKEKEKCWEVYTILTNLYVPHPSRLRDWITMPQSNGYASLHVTLMSKQGVWVEVQIRTERMHERATKGAAAHWKYKGKEQRLDTAMLGSWLKEVRKVIKEDQGISAIEAVTCNLERPDIHIFGEGGKVYHLPEGATVLDFAIEMLGETGMRCAYALVNRRKQLLTTKLRTGEQVQVVLTDRQEPEEGWLNFVITTKARRIIRHRLEDRKGYLKTMGLSRLHGELENAGMRFSTTVVQKLCAFFRQPSSESLYIKIATGHIWVGAALEKFKGKSRVRKVEEPKDIASQLLHAVVISDDEQEKVQGLDMGTYELADCCSPMTGEDIILLKRPKKMTIIHTLYCMHATRLLAIDSRCITRGRWLDDKVSFLATLAIEAIDRKGLGKTILEEVDNFTVESLLFYKDGGIVKGKVTFHVRDSLELRELQRAIRNIQEITKVRRISTRTVPKD